MSKGHFSRDDGLLILICAPRRAAQRRGLLFYAVTLSQRKVTRHCAYIKLNIGRDVFFYRVTEFLNAIVIM